MDFASEYSKLAGLTEGQLNPEAILRARILLLCAREGDYSDAEASEIQAFCALHHITLHAPQQAKITPQNIPADDFISERSSGVSLVTACMNRNANLLVSLLSWLNIPEIKEVLIIDWASQNQVQEDLQAIGIDDSRIRVVRMENQHRWILTRAFNVGFRLASFDHILKADADIIISKDFFRKNTLQDTTFITGDWRIADENQEHINGFFYLPYETLMHAHGFNEFISTYGWDDDDLYERLHRLGYTRRQVDPITIYHQFHENEQRIDHVAGDDKNAVQHLAKDVQFQIKTNCFIAKTMPVWGRRSGFLPVSVVGKFENHLLVKQTAKSFHQVADHIIDDAKYYSAAEIVSWRTSRRVYDLPKSTFWAYLNQKEFDALHRLDISIQLHTQDKADFNRPAWMINFYEDAFNGYFHHKEFLDALHRVCEKLKINLVARVADHLFPQCRAYLSSYEFLFCIPISEAYGRLTFRTPTEVLSALRAGETDYSASKIELDSMPELLNNLEEILSHKVSPPTEMKKRKIYVDAQHGLGNRMRSIASGAAIAKNSNRELIIIWEADNHCEAEMTDLFDYTGPLLQKAIARGELTDCDYYTYMEIEEGAVKDELILLDHDKDVYVRTSCCINSPLTSWEQENAFLKTLTPTSKVQSLTMPFHLGQHVAVHIRMEGAEGLDSHTYEQPDNWSEDGLKSLRHWREKSHYSHFIKRIDALFEDDPEARIFLATDQQDTYVLFKNLYGDKVEYLQRTCFDRSKTQIIYALADALLLSQCERLIGSTWSSFTEIAMRMTDGFNSIEMSGKDF